MVFVCPCSAWPISKRFSSADLGRRVQCQSISAWNCLRINQENKQQFDMMFVCSKVLFAFIYVLNPFTFYYTKLQTYTKVYVMRQIAGWRPCWFPHVFCLERSLTFDVADRRWNVLMLTHQWFQASRVLKLPAWTLRLKPASHLMFPELKITYLYSNASWPGGIWTLAVQRFPSCQSI